MWRVTTPVGRMMAVLGMTLAVLGVAPTAGARAQEGVAVVRIDGKGFGHGVGLSQQGARVMAERGASHEDILATFYPGTELSGIDNRDVRIVVLNSGSAGTTLSFPSGGEVQSTGGSSDGFPVQVAPGGSVVVSFDGSYRASGGIRAQAASAPAVFHAPAQACIPLLGPCPEPPAAGDAGAAPVCLLGCGPTTTTTPVASAPAPAGADLGPASAAAPTVPTSTGSLVAVPADGGTTGVAATGRNYRGVVEIGADGAGLRLVNTLDVETYLRGLAEVPGGWPVEAVKAQAVAARTYALRGMSFSGSLCDHQQCQVYIGTAGENGGQDAAIRATAGEVVTFGGSLASAVFSADAGGITATPTEGFGTSDSFPYLTVVTYDTPDPQPWHVDIALDELGRRFGYAGTVTNVAVAKAGPSGRALEVLIDGDAGPRIVGGLAFQAALVLRSTLFTMAVDVSAVPPPPLDPTTGAAVVVAGPAGATAPVALAAGALGAPMAAVSPRDVAGHPGTWASLALLAVLTALAMERFGFANTRFAPVVGGRRPWPEVALPALAGPTERWRGRRAGAAGVPSATPTVTAPARREADWSALFEVLSLPPQERAKLPLRPRPQS